MATYTWEFGAEDTGLWFTIVFDGDEHNFEVTAHEGSFDLNALWWSDLVGAAEAGKLDKYDNSLNMNGSNTVWDEDGTASSEKIDWDGYLKLSNPGLGSEGEDKPTFISAGDLPSVFDASEFFDDTAYAAFLAALAANPADGQFALGVRATSVDGGGNFGDSIKWVDKEFEVSDDDPENLAPEDIILTIDTSFAARVAGPASPAGATTGVAGAGGILIGILSAVDPDAGDTHTFEVVGENPGDRFVIVGDELFLAEGKEIKEDNGTFELTIKVTDDGDPPHSYHKIFKFVVAPDATGVVLEGSHEGGSGTETDPATGADIIFGFRGTDTLNTYDDEETTIFGTSGDDILFGGHHNDHLYAGDGDNQLFGGNGGDHLYSGSGANILSGGNGDDTFHFLDATHSTEDSFDTIIDWGNGNNIIDVAAIDAKTGDIGNQSFAFGSAQNADVVENSITWHKTELNLGAGNQNVTVIRGDVNGNTDADLYIVLLGHHDLSASDFSGVI